MKRLLFLLFCFSGCHLAFAQNPDLRLVLQSENGNKAATVIILSLPDSNRVIEKVVDSVSEFSLTPNADYILQITAASMEPVVKSFRTGDSLTEINVTMKAKAGALKNVTVVAKKPLIRQEDDKTIVDAEPLANSSTNAYEVLEKIPGIVVDQDGNVYLSSTTPATVYFNGREMKLSSTDIASMLKSLPAGSVQKIELLRSPSAKFDAASSGGIVNIVLKKGVKLGTTGSANIAWFQGVYSTATAGANVNKSAGKITSYFNYQFTKRNNFERLSSERLLPTDSIVAQDAYTTYPSINNYIGAGIDFALSKKLSLNYDFRVNVTDAKSRAFNPVDILDQKNNFLLEANASKIDNDNATLYLGNEISARYKIDSLGSEWITEFDYYFHRFDNDQAYQNFFYLPARNTVLGDGSNKSKKNIFTIQSDLTYKLPRKYTLELGFKVTGSSSRNTSEYFVDPGTGFRIPDPFQTNSFKYRELITAAYVQVSKTLAGFTLKPGLRLETTDIRGRQFIPADTNFSIKRTDIFPYVFLKHNLWTMFGSPLIGNAIYRRSIRRPFYESLNPYPRYVDQYLFDVGNPELTPQFTTNYELNVTFQNFPVFAVGINSSRDIFNQVTYQDDRTKIAYRTYDNIGRNKEVYFKIIGGIPPGGKFFFYIGAQYNHNSYNGLYDNRNLNYKRGSYTFFAYQEIRIVRGFVFNMQGFMRTKGLQNFYELKTFGGLFVSLNKSLFNKKANLILSVNDLLRTNRVSFELNQANISASGLRINDTRRLGLTLRYNFGGKPKEESKSFDAPSEAN